MKVIIDNQLRLSQVPDTLVQILMDRLQFPNPKYLENQRMGRWNRGVPKMLKFFRRHGANGIVIPRGFTRQLILLCRQHQEAIAMDDRRRKLDPAHFVFQGSLKPFQQTAVDAMLGKDFGTLSAPTGSGKTVMALYMIARRRQPTLVIVHTKNLAFQWIERIEAFLNVPAEQVGLIGAGKKSLGAVVTVALVQSLYKCAQEVRAKIGHLIVDECHRTPSRTFTEAVSAFDSQYMLGLSATPWRRDQLSKLIFWHLGDVHHQISKSHLVSKGHILDIEVIVRPTDFKPYYDPVNEYSKMLSELTNDDRRNRLIASDITMEAGRNHKKGVCLVLSDRKRHCDTLQAILKYRHQVDADVLTGDLTSAQRAVVIQRLNAGEVRVLIATGQLIGEGFDCPDLSTLFLTTPVRFSGRVLQYLGRILRPPRGGRGDRARVFDYVDIHVPPLVTASKARQRVYAAQN